MSDLPAIVIDGFVVERSRAFALTRPPRRDRRPSVVAAFRRRYETSIGGYRAFSPRVDSRVEHRVVATVDEVLRTFGLPFDYDPITYEFRAAARLRVRWSWPRLPVWVAVSEVSGKRAAMSIRLRSRRRVRYPRRYYSTAHDVLRAARSGSGSLRDRALV